MEITCSKCYIPLYLEEGAPWVDSTGQADCEQGGQHEAANPELCHCGRLLHYLDPASEEAVRALISNLGEYVNVVTPDGTYRVQRHYIALHGIKAAELAALGFEKVA